MHEDAIQDCVVVQFWKVSHKSLQFQELQNAFYHFYGKESSFKFLQSSQLRLPYITLARSLAHTIIKFIVINSGCGANANVLSLMASVSGKECSSSSRIYILVFIHCLYFSFTRFAGEILSLYHYSRWQAVQLGRTETQHAI